jgi:hypothetical protein
VLCSADLHLQIANQENRLVCSYLGQGEKQTWVYFYQSRIRARCWYQRVFLLWLLCRFSLGNVRGQALSFVLVATNF